MNILINNKNIDFTLDGEENCLDVINGLSTWLETQDFFISEISLDGREFFLQNKEMLKDFSVDNIIDLSVVALDKRQMSLKNLETVMAYFQLYEQALKENNKDVMTDLGNQYSSIRASLPALLKMNDYVFDSTLNKLMDQSGILSGTPKMEKQGELVREWTNLLSLLKGRIGELSSPSQEGLKTVATLKRLIPRLEDVSILFQSGKDREALDIIIVLSELLSKSIRILSSLLEEDRELTMPDGFMKDLNDILNELAEAIDSGDTILTGDLTEYEIVPKIEVLEKIFTNLSEGE